ncbi:MAG: hypothetical protein KY457_02320 [Actinobacteria bacterium]|nr:hypothetical protein [Actinomycetota bacterium]
MTRPSPTVCRIAPVVSASLVLIAMLVPARAEAREEPIEVGLYEPAFWEGPGITASPLDREAFMAGWSYDLHVRHAAPALRVSLDLVPHGLRDWADGRGPETATWSTWGLTNGPAVWLGAVGARFALEVETPSGVVHRSAMTTGYSTELFLTRPGAGRHRVRVVPQDLAEFAAAVNRGVSGREGLSFRLRAQLNDGKLDSPQGELLPNLRIVPPFEIGFAAPTYTFAPSPSVPPGTAHGCMAEEHEEHTFDQLVGALTEDAEPEGPPVHCLRFSAGIENAGDGPLVMSAPLWPDDPAHSGWWDAQQDNFDFPAFQRVLVQEGKQTSYRDGKLGSAGIMRFHPFHGHHHYENAYGYTLYELRGDELVPVAPSRKRGFNPGDEKLADWESFEQCRQSSRDQTAGPGGCAYTAADGIAVLGRGWGDIYEWNRGGQYAEVPLDELGRPRKGTYVLVGTADPDGVIRETDRSDNSSYASFVITGAEVKVCERGYGSGPGDPERRVIEDHDCGG